MTVLSNTPYLIPNIAYSLDYTKNSEDNNQSVLKFQMPNGKFRIINLAYSSGSIAATNWKFKIIINNVPFVYPDGTDTYQAPAAGGVYALCGNVPTDYIDVPPNTVVEIRAYMSGGATGNSVLNFTMMAKLIIKE